MPHSHDAYPVAAGAQLCMLQALLSNCMAREELLLTCMASAACRARKLPSASPVNAPLQLFRITLIMGTTEQLRPSVRWLDDLQLASDRHDSHDVNSRPL